MTEWEKLQTGQLYNDFDRGLFKRRIAAKRLFRAYNRTDDDEQTERRALMEQLFGSNMFRFKKLQLYNGVILQ